MIEYGVYLHVPFCRRRCGYCDFNTFVGVSDQIPKYVKALCNEIESIAGRSTEGQIVNSLFFGGGTPSLLSEEQFSTILDQLHQNFSFTANAEVTIEANPGTVTKQFLNTLHKLGVNRLSFGMQSALPHDLVILNRQHRFEDVVNAVRWSKEAGLQHINLDLIFGIPGQSLDRWKNTLETACRFKIDHLSLYSLIIEEGTPFARWQSKGLLEPIDEDMPAEMYEFAIEFLAESGFSHYEISNWAFNRADGQDARCQHNLNTWRYQPYFGFGAGASGFIGHTRTSNVGAIPAYLQRIAQPQGLWPAAESVIELDTWDEMQEYLMIGLRLTEEGVSKTMFQNRFGVSFETVFEKQISLLLKQKLLEWAGERQDILRLTQRGRMLGNQVFLQFVGNRKPGSLA